MIALLALIFLHGMGEARVATSAVADLVGQGQTLPVAPRLNNPRFQVPTICVDDKDPLLSKKRCKDKSNPACVLTIVMLTDSVQGPITLIRDNQGNHWQEKGASNSCGFGEVYNDMHGTTVWYSDCKNATRYKDYESIKSFCPAPKFGFD